MLHDALATFSGAIVGFVLGLIGGGGSVLAVPLLVYVVGVPSPHVAIGTSSVAVALSALMSLVGHARERHVKWLLAVVFAIAGVLGALVGSTFGQRFDGQKLLLLFGILMIVIAGMMFVKRDAQGDESVHLSLGNAPRVLPPLVGYGLGVGLLSGFFGIGGGFLIVPGLIAATGMPLIYAVGSSLVSVTAFGMTTAGNYAHSGMIDWMLVVLFISGGMLGSLVGMRTSTALASQKQTLSKIFAGIVAATGVYVVIRGAQILLA